MNDTRKTLETAILKRYFENRFLFTKIGRKEVLLVGIKSQSGNIYQIEIELSEIYPLEMPNAFVVYPKGLKNFKGTQLQAFSHEMHTLEVDASKVQVCHFLPGLWNPNQSLYKIILKIMLWLVGYENHLLTAQPISQYLKS